MKITNQKQSSLFCQLGSTLAAGLLGLGLLASFPAGADTDAVSEAHKAIQIRNSQQQGTLQVEFDPLKPSYRVDESIRFRIRGNRPFFLYLYSVDDETGEATLLLPNSRQKGNKYPAHRSLVVPNKSVQFFSNQPGQERVIMVASTRYIDIDTARFKPVGDFLSTSKKGLEEAFEAKGINIRAGRSKPKADLLVQEVNLRITGSRFSVPYGSTGQTGDTDTISFITTNKERYREGEKVRIVYGADKAGWVHLYTIEPGGAYSLLKHKKVDGRSLNQITAVAEAPYGPHKIVVAYTKNQAFDESHLYQITESKGMNKGLRLVTNGPDALTVHRIWIEH